MTDQLTSHLFSIEKKLEVWVKQDVNGTENRQKASQEILRTYDEKTTRLDLSGLGLTTLPMAIKKLPLTELILRDNQLLSFQKNSGLYRRLLSIQLFRRIKLLFSGNRWQEMLKQTQANERGGIKLLKGLPHLERLDLSRNPRLNKLPRAIGRCRQLKELDVSDTKIDKLPAELLDLKKLSKLAFRNTRVQALPCSEGHGFKSLEELSCEGSHLSHLPSARYYKKLKNLKGANTLLKKLPKDFGCLNQLELLDLSHTYLKKIPRSVRKLPRLHSLILRSTQLEKITIQLRYLPKLRVADLRDNLLLQPPKGFERPGVEVQLTGNLFTPATRQVKSNLLVHQLVSSSLSKEGTGGLLPIASNGIPPSYDSLIKPSAPPAWAA